MRGRKEWSAQYPKKIRIKAAIIVIYLRNLRVIVGNGKRNSYREILMLGDKLLVRAETVNDILMTDPISTLVMKP